MKCRGRVHGYLCNHDIHFFEQAQSALNATQDFPRINLNLKMFRLL